MIRCLPAAAAAAMAVALSSPALGDGSYVFTLDSQASSLDTSVNVTAPTSGSLIGNYDAATNPTGTRTKPGIFGTFGETENVPVPVTVTLIVSGDATTHPTGGFTLSWDLGAGTATLSGLMLDLLGADEPGVNVTANANWSSFRTRNPTCTVLGGFTIPIPLGEATITTLSAVQQAGVATGPLTVNNPTSFTVAIPVTVDVELGAEFQGQVIATEPQAVEIVVAATITLDGQGGASVSIALEGFDLAQQQDGPIGDPFQLPFAEPLCGGNLIFTLQLQSLTVAGGGSAALVATGTKEASCPCDWDGNGQIGVPDIFAFLASWFAGQGDFDGVNGTQVSDIFAFLSCWFARPAGCT